MSSEYNEQFRDAMRASGLDFSGRIVSDGRLHRFKARGDRHRNSWYVFHAGPSTFGVFGCWKRGVKETWQESKGQLRGSDLHANRQHFQEVEFERVRAENERRAMARKIAARILSRTAPVVSHPYLKAKGLKPNVNTRQYHHALVLELRDVADELHSLQFISPDGSKRFLTGGRVAGCFCMLAENRDVPLVICEGFATGTSIHEATGFATAVAFSSGNLLEAAKALRLKWPERKIIIAADNDAVSNGNGIAKATEAAKAVSANLAVPQFADISSKPTDFNDLAALEGLNEVKRQILSAMPQTESTQEIAERLAVLPQDEYERIRKIEAKRLGCRVSFLDRLVKRAVLEHSQTGLQGSGLDFVDVEPWPEPVKGPAILEELVNTFLRYIALSVEAAWTLALWCVHAHVYDIFDCSPRLNISSPEKGCGKSTLRDVLAQVVPRPLPTENLSVAVLFRVTHSHKPTLLADEYDAWLKDHEELRAMLNAGHRRGGNALRCEGEKYEVRAFDVFGPVVLCGIGELPGTLHDRSIKVRLERAKPGEITERFDLRRTHREQELHRKILRFCLDNRTALEGSDPQLPSAAFNRVADNWRPLFAIAHVAGSDWPERAHAAFANLVARDDTNSEGIGVMLLTDIKKVFEEAESHRLFSKTLIERLIAMTDRPWPEANRGKPITETWLANRLRPFGILSKTVRIEPDRAKGYDLAGFEESFARYLSTPDSIRDGVTNHKTSASQGDLSRDIETDCHDSKAPEVPFCVGLSPCHASIHPETADLLVMGEL